MKYPIQTLLAPLTILAALTFNSSLAQTELQTGATYQAGSSVKSTYFGVSTRIPNGIVAGFEEQDGRQALGGGTPDGHLAFLMLFQYGINAESYRQMLSRPLPIGQVTLQPVGTPQSLSVKTADPERGIVGQTVALGNGGSSLLLIVFGTRGQESEIANLVAAFRANTNFGKSLAGTGEASASQPLTRFLAGKLLVRSAGSSNNSVNGSGSSSIEGRLVLCSDRTFESTSTSGVAIGISDSSLLESSTQSAQGRWVIEYANPKGAILTLTDQSGLQRRMNLRVVGGNEFVRLNEVAWRVFKAEC
jgi:hypothetical protein